MSELPQAPSEKGRFVGMLGLDVQYGEDGTVSGTLPIRPELQVLPADGDLGGAPPDPVLPDAG